MAQNRFIINISSDCCKGCRLCITVCPKKVLGMSGTLNFKGHYHAETLRPSDCIGCLQCADICPDAAIQIDVEEQA
jgi:2-oxoglutarate ferredoxin oxidoreductase subunit delta